MVLSVVMAAPQFPLVNFSIVAWALVVCAGAGGLLTWAMSTRPKLRLLVIALAFAWIAVIQVGQVRPHHMRAYPAFLETRQPMRAFLYELNCEDIFYYLNAVCWFLER